MRNAHSCTPPRSREKFSVILRSGTGTDSSYHECILKAEDPVAAKEKALRTKIGREFYQAVYCESTDNVRFEVRSLQDALSQAPGQKGFWCLVHDDSDDTFVGVNVVASGWSEAAEAAVESRKREFRLTGPDDFGFRTVLTLSLRERELLLKKLTAGKLHRQGEGGSRAAGGSAAVTPRHG